MFNYVKFINLFVLVVVNIRHVNALFLDVPVWHMVVCAAGMFFQNKDFNKIFKKTFFYLILSKKMFGIS